MESRKSSCDDFNDLVTQEERQRYYADRTYGWKLIILRVKYVLADKKIGVHFKAKK